MECWKRNFITRKDVWHCICLLLTDKTKIVSYSKKTASYLKKKLLSGSFAFNEYWLKKLEKTEVIPPILLDSIYTYHFQRYLIRNKKEDVLVAIALSQLIFFQLNSKNVLHPTYFNFVQSKAFISEVQGWSQTHCIYFTDIHGILPYIDKNKVKNQLRACLNAEQEVHHLVASFLDRLPSEEFRDLVIFSKLRESGLSLILFLSEILLSLDQNIDSDISSILDGHNGKYARFNFTSFFGIPKDMGTETKSALLLQIQSYCNVLVEMETPLYEVQPGGPTLYFRTGSLCMNNERTVQFDFYFE